MGQSVGIAAKVDLTGMDMTGPVLYSYGKAANIYRRIEKPAYWVDTNDYCISPRYYYQRRAAVIEK